MAAKNPRWVMKRRDFLHLSLVTAGVSALPRFAASSFAAASASAKVPPLVISTWPHGLPANQVAFQILAAGGTALDAAEKGVMVPEADPAVTSVGYGGLPNRDGHVELDAAIMDGRNLEAGAVASLRGYKHPIVVARKVMEKTRHVLLVGPGAAAFAQRHGLKSEELLSPQARKRWEEWRADPKRTVPGQVDDHDTIGMVTMDKNRHIAVSCTTSGLAWKIPGRVGDSPLIGHGLYCDDRAGGATATGIGEEIIKVVGSYQVVEYMRQGLIPQVAIKKTLERMIQRDAKNAQRMMAFVAIRADGAIGYGSTIPGFKAAISSAGTHHLVNAPSLVGGGFLE
jgi:L-asparaginase/N4-(beta-N-acetylglucosaminyl)-L-asparaginase